MSLTALPARVFDKIMPCPLTGCWLWTAYIGPNGYGYINQGNRRPNTAHRVVYEAIKGPVPDGLELDHLCRVRSCANPAHLEPVTSAENTRRGLAGANNRAKTHCPKGHPFSGDNLYIYPNGRRGCNACIRANGKVQYALHRDRYIRRAMEQRQRQKEQQHGAGNE